MLIEIKSANFGRGFGGKLFFARKRFPPTGFGAEPQHYRVRMKVQAAGRVKGGKGEGITRMNGRPLTSWAGA